MAISGDVSSFRLTYRCSACEKCRCPLPRPPISLSGGGREFTVWSGLARGRERGNPLDVRCTPVFYLAILPASALRSFYMRTLVHDSGISLWDRRGEGESMRFVLREKKWPFCCWNRPPAQVLPAEQLLVFRSRPNHKFRLLKLLFAHP